MLTANEVRAAHQLADDAVRRRGGDKALRWAEREVATKPGSPFWLAVLARVRAPIPSEERRGIMAATLWPTAPRQERLIRGRPLL